MKPHSLTQKQIRNVKKWIKALRSRKYKQGRGHLCRVQANGKENYCCLGVACEIFKKEYGFATKIAPLGPIGIGPIIVKQYFNEEDSYTNYLPEVLAVEALGLECLGAFTPSKSRPEGHLMELNDDKKLTFGKIADFIEKNLKTNKDKLFK